jgi:hypothetical protein
MKILNLIIKQVYFDQILVGTKKQEFREVKPTTSKKYVIQGDADAGPIVYDAIRFYVGYNKNRDTALVEVTGAVIKVMTNRFGYGVIADYKGVKYTMSEITYDLGKVLESSR